MVEIHILQDIAIIFALSVVTLFVGHRLKLPPIIGFLLAGLVIGPYGLGLIKSLHEVEILAEIGVILLLFAIGMEFSLKDLFQSKRAVLIGGGLQVVLTIVLILSIALEIDFSFNRAIFLGFLIALSSTAIVLRTLQDRNEIYSAHGRVILSILIFQDIIIVPMLIFAPILSGGSGNLLSSIFILAVKGIAIIIAVVLLARHLIPRILYQIARTRSRELFLLSTALICIAVAWSTKELGLSLSLGAFLAGLIISESEYSYQALEGILPFKIVFTSFFFVSIGMLLNLPQFFSNIPVILGSVAAVMIIKAVLVTGVALLLGMSSRSAIIVGLALSQVGEFSFILSKAGITYNLLDSNIYQLFLAVAILTMAITPFIINGAPRIADMAAGWPLLRLFRRGSYRYLVDDSKVSVLNDHLVIIGFGINGKNIARAARLADIPYAIIEMNPDTVRAMREAGEPIIYGDATGHEALKQAVIDRARIAVIAISDPIGTRRAAQLIHESNPNVYIIVRTRFVSEVQVLYDLGASEVIPEEFETSVEIFSRVLMKYLIPRADIDKFIDDIRSHGYEMFRGLSKKSSTLKDLQDHMPDIEINSVRLTADSPLVDKTLAEAQIRNNYNVNVLAVYRDNELIANPQSAQILRAGDIIYIVGSHECCHTAARNISGSD